MKRFTGFLLITVIGILLTAACGLGSKTPSEVVKAFYAAANEGKYPEAEKYLSAETIKGMEGLGSRAAGEKFMLDEMTKNGTIEKDEILQEQIQGETATVTHKVQFKDGSIKDGKETLIKESGEWKVTFLGK